MANTWFIAPEYKNTLVAAAFSDLEAVFALNEKLISHDPQSEVMRVTIDHQVFYVKRYFSPRNILRRHLIRSRCMAEAYNLTYVASLGIPTPKIVALGEETSLGRFGKKRAVLITAEVPDSQDLDDLLLHQPSYLANTSWRRAAIEKVAHHVARLHQARFTHSDLNWRNILAKQTLKSAVLYFFDMPLGRRRSITFRHFVLKDLTLLDRKGREHLSKTDRLRFYKAYRGIDKLRKKDKRSIARILAFYQKKNRHRL
jgi:tRNA A-37 threonylcarbamoyl transferase component Bud32